jgi:organic radical activating enzyme
VDEFLEPHERNLITMSSKTDRLFGGDSELEARFKRLISFSSNKRTMLVHMTNQCNLRCKDCWFFVEEFDQKSQEIRELERWERFAQDQAERGTTVGLLIGGEPTLHPNRIMAIRNHIPYTTISSNGEIPLSRTDFPDTTVALTLFGGYKTDDQYRAIRSNGKRFSGLFSTVLDNYRYDPRAGFVYAVNYDAIDEIEETVKRIQDNGLRVLFNFYRDFSNHEVETEDQEMALLERTLDVRSRYPETVSSTPHFLETMFVGRTHWAKFGFNTCPSISCDFEGAKDRLANGHPTLPGFNAYTANHVPTLCCTGGDCETCRDSQAISSLILSNMRKYMKSPELMRNWVEAAESYWSQFIWSPWHPHYKESSPDKKIDIFNYA